MMIGKVSQQYHSFKIVGDEESQYVHVFMDGEEVKGVKALAVLLDEEGLPVVSMAMYPGELEVDLKEIKLLEEKANASTTDESNNISR